MTRIVAWQTPEEQEIARDAVSEHLAAGGILVYPTETVYGLGCVLDPRPLDRLAAFKGNRPFLLLIDAPEQASGLRWTDDALRLAAAFWPGPLTIALTAEPGRYPAQVVGPDGGVAVRVSPYPGIATLLGHGPITSTSANAPGRAPAKDGDAAAAVGDALEEAGGTALVLDGGLLPEREPSTIVRCGAETRVVREGEIPIAELRRVIDLE